MLSAILVFLLWFLILVIGNIVFMNFIIAVVSENSSRTRRSEWREITSHAPCMGVLRMAAFLMSALKPLWSGWDRVLDGGQWCSFSLSTL